MFFFVFSVHFFLSFFFCFLFFTYENCSEDSLASFVCVCFVQCFFLCLLFGVPVNVILFSLCGFYWKMRFRRKRGEARKRGCGEEYEIESHTIGVVSYFFLFFFLCVHFNVSVRLGAFQDPPQYFCCCVCLSIFFLLLLLLFLLMIEVISIVPSLSLFFNVCVSVCFLTRFWNVFSLSIFLLSLSLLFFFSSLTGSLAKDRCCCVCLAPSNSNPLT